MILLIDASIALVVYYVGREMQRRISAMHSLKPQAARAMGILCVENYSDESAIKKGQEFPLFNEVTYVGSGANNDILLKDPSISRRHMFITKRGNSFYITDTSSYGTYVDGHRLVLNQESSLPFGSEIAVGNISLRFIKS
jgi:hypothetical protein